MNIERTVEIVGDLIEAKRVSPNIRFWVEQEAGGKPKVVATTGRINQEVEHPFQFVPEERMSLWDRIKNKPLRLGRSQAHNYGRNGRAIPEFDGQGHA